MDKKGLKRRSAYLLPTLFTVANIFFGFAAVVLASAHSFLWGAISIIGAGIFDNLDGRVARATNTTSDFGIELDSLSDALSFGMAPAFLVYSWVFQPLAKQNELLHRIGWGVCFFFLVCGILRLARFNVTTSIKKDPRFFQGMSIPVAAAYLIAIIIFFENQDISQTPEFAVAMLVYLFTLGILMISTIPFPSFKGMELSMAQRIMIMAITSAFFIILLVESRWFLIVVGIGYLLLSIIGWLKIMLPKKTNGS